jgi:glutaredoxin-like YruB-family protein
MRNAWLAGLVVFGLLASGFILVRGRAPGEAPDLAGLAAQAQDAVSDAASRLGGDDAADEAEVAENVETREPAVFFRYTDETGTVRFVSSLQQVPKKFRDSARPVANDRVQRAPAQARNKTGVAERALEQGYEQATAHDVVLYSTSWCGWCRKTMAFLKREGVEFENRDIEEDEAWAEELIEKTGSTSIPVVEIDGEIIRGYDPKRMAQLLRSR